MTKLNVQTLFDLTSDMIGFLVGIVPRPSDAPSLIKMESEVEYTVISTRGCLGRDEHMQGLRSLHLESKLSCSLGRVWREWGPQTQLDKCVPHPKVQ